MDASIITDTVYIIDDTFFSETIVHSYPTDQTENLTVLWFNPPNNNDRFEIAAPYFLMKTSAKTNINKLTSRFQRNSVNYKAMSIDDDEGGVTKITVSNVDA